MDVGRGDETRGGVTAASPRPLLLRIEGNHSLLLSLTAVFRSPHTIAEAYVLYGKKLGR